MPESTPEFTARGFGLDVLVIDMDWHLPNSWTGYSWNRELFPDPRGFLAWLHERGLHTTLNLHPALGVQPFEDVYRDFKAAMGVKDSQAVPFRIPERSWTTIWCCRPSPGRPAQGRSITTTA
jgi:alpha-glucosidase (family GH31 glycosyl hydrolase)